MAIKLEEKKKYRVKSKGGEVMEFIPMTIDRESNELYVKITSPISAHQGLVLSSVEESENETEEIPM